MILLILATAWAEPVASEAAFTPKPLAGRPVFDLRVGVLRTDPSSHPYLCAEGQPLR